VTTIVLYMRGGQVIRVDGYKDLKAKRGGGHLAIEFDQDPAFAIAYPNRSPKKTFLWEALNLNEVVAIETETT
jgi:hypothetical protein